jgi:hypothetical protein
MHHYCFIVFIGNSTEKLNVSQCRNFLFQDTVNEVNELQVETSLGPRFRRKNGWLSGCSKVHIPKCSFYILPGLQNTAASCAIVCLILFACSCLTGISSLSNIYKNSSIHTRVPITMTTGILHILVATFLFYLLAILHTKIYEESVLANCYEPAITLHFICLARKVSHGHSLLYAWTTFGLSGATGLFWLYLTNIQKIIYSLNGHFYH